jgi:hypothetical protein
MHRRMNFEYENLGKMRDDILNTQPERRLWKAVIINAITDATKKTSTKYCEINRSSALSWLLKDENNFIQVCELAGLSSKSVRHKLQNVFKDKLL